MKHEIFSSVHRSLMPVTKKSPKKVSWNASVPATTTFFAHVGISVVASNNVAAAKGIAGHCTMLKTRCETDASSRRIRMVE